MSSHDAIGCAARCLAVFGRDRPRGIATCPRVLRFSNVKNGGVLDSKTCDRARIARDPRFDGAFYTGVRTTRIYCRPTPPSAAMLAAMQTAPPATTTRGPNRSYTPAMAAVRSAPAT